MPLQSYKEHIKQISNLLVIFAGIAFKREKVGPIFSSFNPCPFLIATRSNRRRENSFNDLSCSTILRLATETQTRSHANSVP